ncbi:hypothetical protein [Amycolatopsis antarctica]|nr:hypothetical protein [Amycolatopsis antarctica]
MDKETQALLGRVLTRGFAAEMTDLPVLTWTAQRRLDGGVEIVGQAGDSSETEVPGVVRSWSDRLGLRPVPVDELQPGIQECRRELTDGLCVSVWGVVHRDTWEA